MNERTFKALEYEKIIKMISERAFSPLAKEEILNLIPTDNVYFIKDKLEELDELFKFIIKYGNIPINAYINNALSLDKAKKGGLLNTRNFLDINVSIRCARDVKKHIFEAINQDERNEREFERLDDLAKNLEEFRELSRKIEDIIIDVDLISDKASSELYDIRRGIRNNNAKIKEKLNEMISSSKYKKYLSESIITFRNNRYVIPVKSQFKGEVKGIVHDVSSTGASVYIEPQSIVSLNNRIKELEVRESEEIERILRKLSDMVALRAEDLITNENILVFLDVLNAKAKFSIEHDCFKPNISEDESINLRGARHLLLDKKKVIPSDIVLEREYLSLIITGPNTGGKTVCLKTIGLCALLCQSGLFIPAKENSTIPIFDKIYADIGDEQSIAQSLSTFSAHMTNIVDILNNANENTLVLLDELGAGTDPTEGAALAGAILDKLRSIGSRVFATTHYSEIKEYALMKRDVMNASMEFNVETLSPTYKLILGIPGKSNAFEISRKLGLDKGVLNNAKKYLSNENKDFEELIASLNEKVNVLEEEKRKNKEILEENIVKNEEIKKKEEKINETASKIMLDASLEAKNILLNAKRESKKIIDELNNLQQSANKEEIKKEVTQAKKKIREEEKILNSYIPSHKIVKEEVNENKESDFEKGEEVFIRSLNQNAMILGFDGKGKVFVQAGIIKTKIPLSQIEHTNKKEKEIQKTLYSFSSKKAKEISASLDLRGMYGDDAVLKVEKYLDDAYLANLNTVTIIHGRGMGVLKERVTQVLKHHPYVKKYRFGGVGEGGDGASIVTLK